MAKLILSVDDVTIKEIKLAPGVYKIGRKPECEIQLDDATVSGEHAHIEVMADQQQPGRLQVYAMDRNSTNGTLVNGREINRLKLNTGDVVQVGRHELAYFAD